MYVNPFWLGFLIGFISALVLVIGLGSMSVTKGNKDDEDNGGR